MIYGTGIDIVEIGRIRKSLDKYGARFEAKLFTRREIDYCRGKGDPAKHFAARFAAKEAVLKALGTGLSRGIAWKDVEVLNQEETGRPYLSFAGKGKDLFDELRLLAVHLSLSHDDTYAVAQAVAEK